MQGQNAHDGIYAIIGEGNEFFIYDDAGCWQVLRREVAWYIMSGASAIGKQCGEVARLCTEFDDGGEYVGDEGERISQVLGRLAVKEVMRLELGRLTCAVLAKSRAIKQNGWRVFHSPDLAKNLWDDQREATDDVHGRLFACVAAAGRGYGVSAALPKLPDQCFCGWEFLYGVF